MTVQLGAMRSNHLIFCNVVRIEWPQTRSKLPSTRVVGAIAPLTRVTEVYQLLRTKGFSEAFVCQLQDLQSRVTCLG